MTFSGITTSITNSAKSMNGLVQQIGTQLKTQFAPTIDKINDGIDVLKAGQDVVSTVVKDVTGQDVTIRSIQKGAADFDKKWDEFAKEINEKFNKAQSSGQADILETFAKSHFGDDVYNLGSAIKNELPGVLDGIADYKDAIDSMKSDSKTAEEAAVKIQKGVDTIVEATQKVAGSLNKAVEICTGNGLPILDDLSKIGGSAAVGNLKKVIGVGVSGATAATAFNQMKDAAKNKDFKGITDAMAKGATAVDNLLSDLGNMVPGFPKAQIPSQITASISRLQNGQAVYDAARSMVTALVVDASGPITPKTLASLTSDFNKNWDTFSDKINALFNVSPTNGQTAVLETLGKNMFGPNVFNAAGAIKRQLPGVLEGVAGVQDALKQFGGSYRNPIEAATKIRNGVEKMVQSIEKIGQSLNNMVKHYQGNGIMANGTGYPLLDTLEKLGDTKGIQALDTTLRICGGAVAVAGNAGVVAQAIKNKDIPGAIAAVKKTVDDVQKLTKKGNYKIDDGKGSKSGLPNNSPKASDASNNGQQNSPKNKNNLSSAATDSYVCSTATMKCTMGTSQAKLTVLPTRTVFLTGKPMANISDHLTMVNLAPFGRCRSMGFPATASATAANYGTLTPMPCMHNTPFPWMGGKNDYIIKGNPALLKSSTCQCMWGGTISLITDGQMPTGPVDLSKSPQDNFSRSSSRKKTRNKGNKGKEQENIGITSHKDIEGFEKWIDEKDAADLAADAYSSKKIGEKVNGWAIIESLGEKGSKDDYEKTGFKAKLYEKDGKYVFVTAGTNPLSGKDWANNIAQQFGWNSKQYNQSIECAKEYAKRYKNLVFIGHSLGGGLASANSRATGCSAITFNAAALSSNYNLGMDSKIVAYISDGDILDYVNEVLLKQKIEGVIIRRSVSASKIPNLQGIPFTGIYQAIRGVKAHTDYKFIG